MRPLSILLLTIAIFCGIFIPRDAYAQPGILFIPVPEGTTVVNGTLNLFGNISNNYYVGYGDTVICTSVNGLQGFYIDNGGCLKVIGNCIARVWAANYSTIDASMGSIDSLFTDIQANILGTNNNTWIMSTIHFSLTLGQSDLNSFQVYGESHCVGPDLVVHSSGNYAGMNIITEYGDGTIDTNALLLATAPSYSYAAMSHTYAVSDTYNIKQVLFDNTNRIDSVEISYIHLVCSEMAVFFYNDLNSNCLFDSGVDQYINIPLAVEVDSNGVVIDTIGAQSGVNYKAYGNTSAIYTFTAVNFSGGLFPACPVSGSVTDTFLQGWNDTKYVGFNCVVTNNFDLGINIQSQAGTHAFLSYIDLQNTQCTPQNAVFTMNYDPVYTNFSAIPAPVSQTPGVAIWNVNNLSNLSPYDIAVSLDGGYFPTGIPVTTSYAITPTINDLNPSDNSLVVIDTTVGSWDPNAIYVTPEGCTPAGTKLEYTITFENLGNGVAQNIYILDTLPYTLRASSMRLLYASHNMFVEKIDFGRQTILKFNFPNIMLPDSSDHLGRHGRVKYSINLRNGISFGTTIKNRAGIFFDFNSVVLTNTANTGICWPASINETVAVQSGITIYPNPATDDLTIKTEKQFTSYTITNSIGQVMMERDMNSKESKVNIKSLSTGIYYISLKGEQGSEIRKFVKL